MMPFDFDKGDGLTAEPGVLYIEVSLPPQGCAQNGRHHWSDKGRATKQSRNEAAIKGRVARNAKGWSTADRVRISHTWFMGRHPNPKIKDGLYRPHDEQNAWGALKAAVDGLVDAGVVVSDKSPHVQLGTCQLNILKSEHQGRRGVLLRVERLTS